MNRGDTTGAAWLAAAAALLIGIGAAANNAQAATALLVFALVASIGAVLAPASRALCSFSARSVVTVVALGVAVLAFGIPARSPVLDSGYVVALLVLTAVGIHALLTRGRWGRVELAVVAVGHFVVMAWMIGATALPDIDVWVFQQQGSDAVLRGENPFAMTFDFTVSTDSPYYVPEVVDGDRLNFGFIYPPVSLLMAVPGYLIGGDYRYGAAAALAMAAVVIALIRPGKLAIAGALLLLLNPLAQQVLYWGWTDPFSILLLALTIFVVVRQSPSSPVWLGLLLASKQYMAPMLLPAAALLSGLRARIGMRQLLLVPIAVAVLTALPFLIWDFGAFVYSTVSVHLLQPFRPDSLSIPAVIYRAGGPELPSVLSFAVAGLAMTFVIWKAPRTPAGFCIGMAVVLLAFFLFSKQAFMHYYYLVLAILACSVAASDTRLAPDRQET